MEKNTDNKLWILPHGIAVRDNRHLQTIPGLGAFSIIDNKDVFKSIELTYWDGTDKGGHYEFIWKPMITLSTLYPRPTLKLTIASKDEIMEEFRKAIEVLEAIEVKLKESNLESF